MNHNNNILLTPGPTPMPEQVIEKMAQPIIHHRTKEFRELFGRVRTGLKEVFQTQEEVLVLTSSGSGAMEAAVANLFKEGDRALTIESGKFSERWGELCEAYNILVVRHRLEWGKSCSAQELEELLKQNRDLQAIFITHCETSTSAVIDLQKIAEVIHNYSDALVVVDGITSVGAIPLKMDEWGIDVVISGSQKAFRCPPGLAFIACSKKAWTAIEAAEKQRYYFDLRKARTSQMSNDTPFTPAITLLIGLDEALRMILQEGVQNIWNRNKMLATALREALKKLGFVLLAQDPSDSITAVRIPESLKEFDLRNKLREKGFIVAGGQGKLKGEILRISHMGTINADDLFAFLTALEGILITLCWEFEPGIATSTFQQRLQDTTN